MDPVSGGPWDIYNNFLVVAASGVNLLPLCPWVDFYIDKANLEFPVFIDSTGAFDSMYVLLNLEDWFADPKPIQDEYVITDGICPDLPGFLVGTTPFVFDSLAPPEENPFSTTPYTGVVQLQGNGGLLSSCCFDRGDADDNSEINVADLSYLVDYLFKGGPEPNCSAEGDANGDGIILVDDLVLLVDYLFKGGLPPVECP